MAASDKLVFITAAVFSSSIACSSAEGGGSSGPTPGETSSPNDAGHDGAPTRDAQNADSHPPPPPADGGAKCSGAGPWCGSRWGLDPSKLYDCSSGTPVETKTCAAACLALTEGDGCPCPAGDRAYCGEEIGGDKGKLYDCAGGKITLKDDCRGAGCTPAATGATCTSSGAGTVSCAELQWWNTPIGYGPNMVDGWWDTDLAVDTHTKIQLRHDSQLYAEAVYDSGWTPEFVDQVTHEKFRFGHLQPTAKYTTEIGRVYPAGTIVGLSGGDSPETGYPTYSTGAHLCVQTIKEWLSVFPLGTDPCH